jgi:predicted MFS family arabinose efflux permease
VLFTSLLFAGVAGWALGAGIYALMACGAVSWGLGFASTNSMQQVRLVGAAPALATASVSLNTSVLYIGQAVGSAVGGMLYARDLLSATGYVGIGFVALAVITVISTRRMSPS